MITWFIVDIKKNKRHQQRQLHAWQHHKKRKLNPIWYTRFNYERAKQLFVCAVPVPCTNARLFGSNIEFITFQMTRYWIVGLSHFMYLVFFYILSIHNNPWCIIVRTNVYMQYKRIIRLITNLQSKYFQLEKLVNSFIIHPILSTTSYRLSSTCSQHNYFLFPLLFFHSSANTWLHLSDLFFIYLFYSCCEEREYANYYPFFHTEQVQMFFMV